MKEKRNLLRIKTGLAPPEESRLLKLWRSDLKRTDYGRISDPEPPLMQRKFYSAHTREKLI
jgi:hypothetical protein